MTERERDREIKQPGSDPSRLRLLRQRAVAAPPAKSKQVSVWLNVPAARKVGRTSRAIVAPSTSAFLTS